MIPGLQTRRNGGATVRELEQGLWRLELPPGPAGVYRWGQLDDYMHHPRRDFPWRLPLDGRSLRLELRARVSAANLPGTWGFGFWNDPFSASLGIGGTSMRLPALPNCAWFFYAGPPNYLAFRDTHPAQGLLAATFASPRIPSLLLAPGAVALPLLTFRAGARLVRRVASRLINEEGALVQGDPTAWRTYRLDWGEKSVSFFVDGEVVLTTPASPPGPLGLVLWIDNQYAAFPASGRLSMGASESPAPAWLEVKDITLT